MLEFDQTQTGKLRDARRAAFEDEMCTHIGGFAPRHARVLGAVGTLAFVQTGMAAAERRGFGSRGPLRTWLETAMTLGSHFDTDPIFAGWFDEIFTDADPVLEMTRADMLYRRLVDYIDEVLGPEREHARNAMRRLRSMAGETVPEQGAVRDLLLARLRDAFPTKWQVLGEARHRAMLDTVLARAARFGARDRRCLTAWGVMALVMGHPFDADPLYPWVSRTLADTQQGMPDERIQRLEVRSRTYLDAVIKGF
jgi:hypothetical protein